MIVQISVHFFVIQSHTKAVNVTSIEVKSESCKNNEQNSQNADNIIDVPSKWINDMAFEFLSVEFEQKKKKTELFSKTEKCPNFKSEQAIPRGKSDDETKKNDENVKERVEKCFPQLIKD